MAGAMIESQAENQSYSDRIDITVEVHFSDILDFIDEDNDKKQAVMSAFKTLLRPEEKEQNIDETRAFQHAVFYLTNIVLLTNACDQESSKFHFQHAKDNYATGVKMMLASLREEYHAYNSDDICKIVNSLLETILEINRKHYKRMVALKLTCKYKNSYAVKALMEAIELGIGGQPMDPLNSLRKSPITLNDIRGYEEDYLKSALSSGLSSKAPINAIDFLVSKQNMDPVDPFEKRCLLLAAQKSNAKAFSLLSSVLFIRAIQMADATISTKFLNSHRKECSNCVEILCAHPVKRKFYIRLVAFDLERPQGSCISFCDWLEGVYMANDLLCLGIRDQLLNFEKIVSSKDRRGWTALHLAMFKCQDQPGMREIKTVEILLESGRFKVNALSDDEETALHFACRCTSSNKPIRLKLQEMTRQILELRVNINQRNSSGQTAFMIACKHGNTVAVRELIKWIFDNGYTLDIEAKDYDGQTALMLAKQSNNEEVVEIMKEKLFLYF